MVETSKYITEEAIFGTGTSNGWVDITFKKKCHLYSTKSIYFHVTLSETSLDHHKRLYINTVTMEGQTSHPIHTVSKHLAHIQHLNNINKTFQAPQQLY